MINPINNSLIIYPEGYVEKICSDYFTGFDNLIIKVIIINILYFLFLKILVGKIKPIGNEKFSINLSQILETVVFMGNITVGLYYIVFNYNTFIFDKLNIIKSTITFIIIAIVVYFLWFNKERIFKFIKELKFEE